AYALQRRRADRAHGTGHPAHCQPRARHGQGERRGVEGGAGRRRKRSLRNRRDRHGGGRRWRHASGEELIMPLLPQIGAVLLVIVLFIAIVALARSARIVKQYEKGLVL